MDEERELMIREFFRTHGWIAEIPEDYKLYVQMMSDLVEGSIIRPKTRPEDCITKGESYEYEIVSGGKLICKVPAITDRGYFIIQGAEKVLLIQEIRLKTEHYVSASPLFCECTIMQSPVPARIRVTNSSVVELDTSMIHNNLRGIKSIGIHEVLVYIFLTDIAELYTLILSYCKDRDTLDFCMVLISSSSKGIGGILKSDKDVIRDKMFKGLSNLQIVMTISSMLVECARVMFGGLGSVRDDYCLKRLRTPGEIVYGMFRSCVRKSKSPSMLQSSVKNKIYTCLRRGDIVVGGRKYEKMAVQLSKRSLIDSLSSVRKVVVPCDINSPNIDMRQIHKSQRGFVCPCETPEGKTVGTVKHLAACCLISKPVDLTDSLVYSTSADVPRNCYWIMLDGAVVGWATSSSLIRTIKDRYPMVSCTIQDRSLIKIRSASGRPIRPLLNIKDHPVDWRDIMPWNKMVEIRKIQYVDPQESVRVADNGYNYEWSNMHYMEIHPCTMLGLAASLIPFPEHNQSARNVFASSMIKQSQHISRGRLVPWAYEKSFNIGISRRGLKTTNSVLSSIPFGWYEKACNTLQRPLVSTLIGREMGYDQDPNGVNLVTCIMSFTGYNQEDAIIIKKSCVERGLFSSIVYKTIRLTVENPWKIIKGDGGIRVLSGKAEKKLVEARSMLESPALVSVKERISESGHSVLDITFVENRHIQLGDKLASRHAQKGVVGMILSEEDMPFTKDGITPDIIINPHAIPSRMTVGQLIEGVLGKACCINGTFEDGTPFIRKNMRDIKDIVKMRDTEAVILGTTGEMVKTPVVMGVVYYMALKHQAADKIYVRAGGSKSMMSRQPISGRSKGGGLRFGEMEYDCLIAHGASSLVTDVSRNSDMADVYYCEACKIVLDVGECRLCKKAVAKREVPFSYVVYKDLMLSANIKVQTKL